MKENKDLEQRLSKNDNLTAKNNEITIAASTKIEAIKNYFVDTTAAWIFYTPLMGAVEYFAAGMQSKEILKSRLFAAAYHALFMRPYGMFRQWYADKWNADYQSSAVKKLMVDTSAMFIIQIPSYSTILYLSGASQAEIAVALPVGLGLGAITARAYGYFLDKWRKQFGTKPTLDL